MTHEKRVKADAISKEFIKTAIITPIQVAFTIQKVVSVFQTKKANRLSRKTDCRLCNSCSINNKGTNAKKSKNGNPFVGQAKERRSPESSANDIVRNIFCIIA